MSLVLDCSAAAAWCFSDERTDKIVAVMLQVRMSDAFVPTHWRLELANTLRTGIKRKRLTALDRDALMTHFATARIIVDSQTNRNVFPDTVRLSDKHGLTIYDAAYLELASRLALPLASLDTELRDAAAREGVALLGL